AGAEPGPRARRLLQPHAALADRTQVAVVTVGLAAVPRARDPRPARAAARTAGPARGRRVARGALSARQVASAARGSDRSAARRLRSGADVLAVHVHPLVFRLRSDC